METDLKKLWEFNRIFPNSLKNKSTNKKEYWSVIDKEIIAITNTTREELNSFLDYSITILNKSPNSIKEYNYDIAMFLKYIKLHFETIKEEKKKQLDELDKELLEQMLLNLMIKEDTKNIEQSIININKFRVNQSEEKDVA